MKKIILQKLYLLDETQYHRRLLKYFLLTHDDWISLPKAQDYNKVKQKKNSVARSDPAFYALDRAVSSVLSFIHAYIVSPVYINIFIFRRIATYVVEKIRSLFFVLI